MNINMPDLVKAATSKSDAEGRNARIVSSNSGPNYRDPKFLSNNFPRAPPKLYFIAELEDFDDLTLSEWRDEGFDVEYFAMPKAANGLSEELRLLNKKHNGPCETFGIVAYGDAAAVCLQHYHVLDNNSDRKMALLIAYYPTAIPDTKGQFPDTVTVLVHLAVGEEIGIIKQTQMVGIQGKRRVVRKKVDRGIGAGGTLKLAYPTYTYAAEPGFAEHDMEEYDRISAELAWSRSLATARDALGTTSNLELALEENEQGKFFARNAKQALSAYTTNKTPHVTHLPTLTGGSGAEELRKFYTEAFANPPSLRLTLLSRTVGADRVVDEFHVKFDHTEEMPWMIPGVPATQKSVEVLMVSIVALRGGKLYHEHVYWDQASVLVQIGLIDPSIIPETGTQLGVKRLPIVGRKAARKLLSHRDEEEEGKADNRLIRNWRTKEESQENPNEDARAGQEKNET